MDAVGIFVNKLSLLLSAAENVHCRRGKSVHILQRQKDLIAQVPLDS